MVIERVLLWLQQHSATFLDTLYVSSRGFVSAINGDSDVDGLASSGPLLRIVS